MRMFFKKTVQNRLTRQVAMFSLLRLAAFANLFALFSVCTFLVWNGLPTISWEFLTQPPVKAMTAGGIWPCIVGTALLALGALAVSFPLGVASAVYLHEYAGRSRFAQYVRLGVNNLAGVPSIVFGLFGMSFFVIYCGLGISLLSGILTLAVLTLPVIIGTAEEALRQVPMTYREASLALGATQSQTIARVVLPAALPGMLTGAILGLARAAGETAAIMFTAVVFFTKKDVDSLFSPVMSLSNHMYVLATSGTDIEKTMPLQYGTALVLIVLVLGMNLLAIVLRDRLQNEK
jgi:phosphate ABC transporter, permease protein PstA